MSWQHSKLEQTQQTTLTRAHTHTNTNFTLAHENVMCDETSEELIINKWKRRKYDLYVFGTSIWSMIIVFGSQLFNDVRKQMVQKKVSVPIKCCCLDYCLLVSISLLKNGKWIYHMLLIWLLPVSFNLIGHNTNCFFCISISCSRKLYD